MNEQELSRLLLFEGKYQSISQSVKLEEMKKIKKIKKTAEKEKSSVCLRFSFALLSNSSLSEGNKFLMGGREAFTVLGHDNNVMIT